MRIVPTVLCLLAGSTAVLADSIPTLWGVQMSGNAGVSTPLTGQLTNSFSSGSAASAGFIEQLSYLNSTGSTASGTVLDPVENVLYDFSANSSIIGSVTLGDFSVGAFNKASGLHVVMCGLAICRTDAATASSSLNAHWFDTLTLVLANLPLGTPEDFLVTSNFVASLVGDTYPGGNGASALYTLSIGNCAFVLPVNQSTPDVNSVQTCVLHAISGQVLRVDGQLNVTSIGTTQWGLNYSGFSSVTVFDPEFLLDPITPGATYSSASGTSYETPAASAAVPEPDTLGLMILGVLALASASFSRSARRVDMRLPHALQNGRTIAGLQY